MTNETPIIGQMQKVVDAWVASGGQEKEEKAVHAILNDPAYEALPYAQRNAPFLTSSKIKEFARCPFHACLRYVNLVELDFEEAEHFRIGRALDTLLTYGRDGYFQKFAVVDSRVEDIDAEIAAQELRIKDAQKKLNKDGTRSKPGLDAEEKAKLEIPRLQALRGKTQLTLSQGSLVDQMETEYLSREFFPKKLTKRNVLWLMFGKIPCKAEWDHDEEGNLCIHDTKTTGSLSRFDPSDYLIQAGFYFEGALERLQQQRQVALNVCDKNPKWCRSHQWIFSVPTLQAQQGRIHQLATEWMECLDSGVWPHIDVDSDQGKEVCWDADNQLYNTCPFCKSMKPTIL